MGRKTKKEINIYSTSAIDLFASGMGVFLFLTILALPNIQNTSQVKLKEKVEEIDALTKELSSLAKARNDFQGTMEIAVKSFSLKMEERYNQITEKIDITENEVKKIKMLVTESKDIIKQIEKEVQKERLERREIERKIAQIQQKLIRKIEEAKTLSQEKSILQMAQEQILNDNSDLKVKTENLQRELASSIKPDSAMLGVILSWFQEKHDMDLIINSPSGKKYLYDPDLMNAATGISSDAKTGPGTEVWTKLDYEPGEYKIKIYLHGTYGNAAVPRFSFVAFSNMETKNSKTIEQKIPLGKEVEIANFSINEKGKLSEFRYTY